MALLDIKNLSFSHPGASRPIFDNVNLQLDTDWKLGLIGRNGYGKTTFLHLLCGKLIPRGNILSPVDFDYFPYRVENPTLSTLEVVKNLQGEFPLWQLQKEMNLIDLKDDILYRTFTTLSHGEQTKVLLATMFIAENKFLLIDEPTNHLDSHGRKAVAEYLAGKKGFIVASHDRDFLNISVDHILAIERNQIVLTRGNFDTWQHNKHLEDEFELAQNEKLRKEIRRLKKSARQKSLWSDKTEKTKIGHGPVDRGYIGHMAAKMMKTSKVIERRFEKAIENKESLLKNIEIVERLQVEPLKYHSDNLLAVEDFEIFFDSTSLFQPLTFNIDRGECLVLQGVNGSGKSSLLKVLLGKKIDTGGILRQPRNLVISYVPQQFDFLSGSLFDYIEANNIDKTQFLTVFRKMGISRDQFDIPMEDYSNGQKKKVLLAKSLCESAHIYLWDEPLNYIDIISRLQIEKLILEYAPTMILVEHDKKFIDRVATDIVELEGYKR